MAKIHGLAYIVIGVVISASSYAINYTRLVFFFYIGQFFILGGLLKLAFNFVKKKADAPKAAHAENWQGAPSQHGFHRQVHRQQYRRRPKCSSVMRANDRFCSRCGARV